MPDVVCTGILVADVWAKPVDEWPERGRLSLCDRIGIGIGGCASNTAIDLAKLGASVVAMGKVGEDGFGDFVIQTLENNGVETQVARSKGAGTSSTMVFMHSDAERTFIHYVGANAEVRPEDLDMDVIKSARFLHVAGALVMPGFDGEPMASVLGEARRAGVITCLDTVWDATGSWMDVLEPCLRETDVFVPSLPEAQELTGETDPPAVAKKLLSYGVEIVALKMGEDGSYTRNCTGQEFWTPVYPVDVVDGTGSGDAFAAGFIRGMLAGWPLEKTSRFANAVGAQCVTGVGTVAGVKPMGETLAWLRTLEPEDWKPETSEPTTKAKEQEEL